MNDQLQVEIKYETGKYGCLSRVFLRTRNQQFFSGEKESKFFTSAKTNN